MFGFACIFLFFCCTKAVVKGPITSHFQAWLNKNGFEDFDFARGDFGTTGSYGGKTNDETPIKNTPVVFIHGNSDGALNHSGPYSSGSTDQIEYFLSKGYSEAELYVTTWGNRTILQAGAQAHNCSIIFRLRRFIEAVMQYTERDKISVVAHSMGVTLARKIIKGGALLEDLTGKICNIGIPLTAQIDVFIGISGANFGMCTCLANTYTCNSVNGFWPGEKCGGYNEQLCGSDTVTATCNDIHYSALLKEMNEDMIREADHIYTIWSSDDDVLLPNCRVWGRITAMIPTMDADFKFTNLTHMQTKELTPSLQFKLLKHLHTEHNLIHQLSYFLVVILICVSVQLW